MASCQLNHLQTMKNHNTACGVLGGINEMLWGTKLPPMSMYSGSCYGLSQRGLILVQIRLEPNIYAG